MKNTNYYIVHGWMINELGLKGNDLLIYAIIYGFSQDGSSEFTGSLNYLVKFVNSTKQTIINSLKHLTEIGALRKTERPINGQNFPTYMAIVPDFTSSQNFLLGGQKSLTGDSQKIIPNNNTINNNSIIEQNDPKESFKLKLYTKWTEEEFKASIQDARETRASDQKRTSFSKEMLNDFFMYWKAPTPKAGVRKFQSEKSWDTMQRLNTWQKRS